MDSNDDQSKKAESPWQSFCERVTVAGLEDLYTAIFLPTRWLFAMGMVMSTLFGLFTSYRTIQQTLDETTSVNIQFKDDGDMLFPNVTICTTAVLNTTATRELLVVPREVEEKLKKMGIDRQQFVEEIVEYESSIYAPLLSSHQQYMDAVFRASITVTDHESYSFQLANRTSPSCNWTLSNCTYDGNPIDCCNGIVLGSMNAYFCYGVPLSTMPREPKPFSRPIEFNVDVKMDWAHIPFVGGEDALDGFLVIVSEPFTTTNTAPVAVAPGWHGTIKLTRIRRRTDRTDCVANKKLPNMNYLSYYDQDGKNCELDIGTDMIRSYIQCTPQFGNYFPNNTQLCSVQQVSAARLAATGAGQDNDKVAVQATNAYRNKMGSMTKRCKPICQRWQYEPIVGYSELRDNYGRTIDASPNISWSRITVTIPSSYYEEHMEEERSDAYVIFCNVGGAMGVCLGLSAVTLVQVVAYGLHSFYIFKRNRKSVHPNDDTNEPGPSIRLKNVGQSN